MSSVFVVICIVPPISNAQFKLHNSVAGNGWHFALWSYRPDPDPAFLYFDYEKWGVLYWETILSFFTAKPVAVDQISPPINLPVTEKLFQNYPNPFNNSTTINFALPSAGNVKLTVYDITGKLVRTLINYNLNAGYHNIVWNGSGDNGLKVASGVYIFKIEAGNFNQKRKMMLLK